MNSPWEVEVIFENVDRRGEVLAISWSPTDEWIAVSYSHGYIKLFDAEAFCVAKLFAIRSVTTMPFTGLCWEPMKPTQLLAVSADAQIGVWDAHAGCLIKAGTLPAEQGLCCDISPDGEVFAVGTNQASIVIASTTTIQVASTLEPGYDKRKGHTNRVTAVKWVQKNYLLSAGWDCVVLLWEINSCSVIKSFYRAFVCGSAIDIRFTEALVGAYDRADHIQVYDYFTNQVRVAISLTDEHNGKVFACRFSKLNDGELSAAVGNRVRVFDSYSFERLYRSEDEDTQWFACDWAQKSHLLAVGGSGGTLQVLEFTKDH